MMSRIYGWTTESVQAMNLIEIVFADDDTVCKQWKVYYDKLCVENPTETELQKIKKEDEKLLETMAKSLGYKNITLATIQSPYIPKGMTEQRVQQQKYQNDQSVIMEQMKRIMQSNGGKLPFNDKATSELIMEETGLTITNLRYFGSQPWPYPCGLMVGYNADYVSGDIRLQKEELSRGNWFTKDALPQIPEKLSIARRILDDWFEEGPGHTNEVIYPDEKNF